MISLLKDFWQKNFGLVIGISVLLAFCIILCKGVSQHSDVEEKRLQTAVQLTPEICVQKCKPLSVSFYTPGFIIVDFGGPNNKSICYSGGYNCSASFEEACSCASTNLINNK